MQTHPASYRDNSGFIFEHNGLYYRYVHPVYEPHYSRLMDSGLYENLVTAKELIAHQEISEIESFGFTEGKVLIPQQVPFISYPYEWSFDMWKDAALLTLHIATRALEKDMMLKDATPFNVQFIHGKPVFIDTLSVENYIPGNHWVAYRQFCECFLGPLLLMKYAYPDAGKLFAVYPNGIPVSVLANLLPQKTRWNLGVYLHIHLQAKFAGKTGSNEKAGNKFSRQKLELVLKGLQGFVQKLSPKKVKTTWDDYYTGTILGNDYLLAKTRLVESFTQGIIFNSVIDLGANDGHFSLLFGNDKQVIATDADSNCINHLYLQLKKEGRQNILPLVNDLTAPSPAIGWANNERDSLTTRLKAQLVLALALVHHLAIGKNIPLALIANWLAPMCQYLIIEFVPKDDEKVKQLLQHRTDIFDWYSPGHFKAAFETAFSIEKEEQVGNTGRTLFLMKRR